MHEIVTIQLGSQANYVASHFWNAQESYFTYSVQDESPVDHDIHFRPGLGDDGAETYTPRTIIYDFKRNFGTMKRINELYDAMEDHREASVWGGTLVPQHEPAIEQSSYQAALAEGIEPATLTTSNVRYWSDYSRTYFHPRSVVQIYETDLDLGQRAFDDWESGAELYRALEGQEDLIDRDLRPFAEECDQMQGLQLLFGAENAWAGFTARYLDRVRDEYGKLPVWVWALGEAAGTTHMSRHCSIVNQAKAVYEISPQASLYVPVASEASAMPNYISLDKNHPWHTSALQETAFESVLLPTRMKRTSDGVSTTLDHLAMALSGGEEWKIAQMSFGVGESVTAHAYTNGHAGVQDARTPSQARNSHADICNLFPDSSRRADADERIQEFAEIHCTRGEVEEDEEMTTTTATQENRRHEHQNFRRLTFRSSLAMPLLSSFPALYSLRNRTIKSASIQTTLKTSSTTADWLRGLDLSSQMRIGVDEREELSDGLKTIRETYMGDLSEEDDDWYD